MSNSSYSGVKSLMKGSRTVSSLLCSVIIGLSLTACGGGGSSAQGDTRSGAIPTLDESTTLQPAVSTSSYSALLANCVLADNDSSSCSLEALPMIGQETNQPDIATIMERVVVSHDWMAARFEQLLRAAPGQLPGLMKSLTAVVISADIRPSYYSSTTGAIYLDPAYLWLTNTEKKSIDQGEDYRSGFDDELAFVSLSRYVLGNDYAWDFYALDGDETRQLEDIVLPAVRLLFHELAHANDFFPPHLIGGLDRSNSVAEAGRSLSGEQLSRQLDRSSPLQSTLLHSMAAIMYQGDTPSASDRTVSAMEVGLSFEIDGANDDYAYSSIYEDTAMLFEEVMMRFHFGVAREIGYTDRPQGNSPTCSDYVVRWGLRHRTGSDQVLPRAEQVLQYILQQNDVSAYLNDLEPPIDMQRGVDWCTNLAQFPTENAVIAPPPPLPRVLRPDDRNRHGRIAGSRR